MTEKVVSLSGGLVLGMVFALFLGIGATQNLAPNMHFEMPAILQMTIAQATHNTSATAGNTTPNTSATPPSEEDRGRITRIATLTETADPAFTAPQEVFTPKNWNVTAAPKIDNTLQRVNLQRSYMALAGNTSQTSTYVSLGQAASRESNFTAIADNSSGRDGYGSGHQPSLADDKPQSHGSPAIAQNNPDSGEEGEGDQHGEDPDVAAGSAKPGPRPDFSPDYNIRVSPDPERPSQAFLHHHGDQSENELRDPVAAFQHRRPETD